MAIEVTAVVNIKHAALRRAVKKLGSVKKLAIHLGVSLHTAYAWCNLRQCPPARRDIETHGRLGGGGWTVDKLDELEKKLVDITGELLDDIFPEELREVIREKRAPKQFEITKTIEADALLSYAAETSERLALPGPDVAAENKELSEALQKALSTLSYREREVVICRWGLKGDKPLTLSEATHIFKVTEERIRQIEARAIRRLKESSRSDILVSFVDFQTKPHCPPEPPRDVWPSEIYGKSKA